MDATNVVALAVALIAAISAFASQRASAKAAKAARIETARIELQNSRVDMEKSAYERARAFDTDTIARQNKRISELSREVRRLNALVLRLRTRIENVDHMDESDESDLDEFDDFEEPIDQDS